MMDRGADSLLFALWRGLLGLAFPAHCALCDLPLEPQRGCCLCEGCLNSLPGIRQPFCPECGRPVTSAVGIPFPTRCGECRLSSRGWEICRSAGLYEGSLKECVHLFKYGGRRELAKPLAGFMAEFSRREMPGWKIDLIVPVPLHPRRLRERGFNQAALLAAEFGALVGIPVCADALGRPGIRPSQSTLARAERLRNIRGVFVLKKRESIEGKRLLIIDDVFTTGATVGECARILITGGAESVDVLTLARGV